MTGRLILKVASLSVTLGYLAIAACASASSVLAPERLFENLESKHYFPSSVADIRRLVPSGRRVRWIGVASADSLSEGAELEAGIGNGCLAWFAPDDWSRRDDDAKIRRIRVACPARTRAAAEATLKQWMRAVDPHNATVLVSTGDTPTLSTKAAELPAGNGAVGVETAVFQRGYRWWTQIRLSRGGVPLTID